jgi:hypothetical protein
VKAWIGFAVAVGILALAAPAGATVTRTSLRASTTRTSEDPGCRLVDLQTLHENIKGWLIDVNGSTHVDLLLSGTVTFEELGQSFAGTYSLPITMYQQPDGSFETTGSYTAVAKGDEGDVAMLHQIAHVTFFAPDRLDTSISTLHHTCT